MQPYYQDEAVTIYNADAREIISEMSSDLLFADPPYGVGVDYNGRGDDPEIGREVFDIASSVAPLMLWTPGIRNIWKYPKSDWVLAWLKPGATGRSDLGGFNTWEPVLMYGKRVIWQDSFLATPGALTGKTELNLTKGHPCPKPKYLMTQLIEQMTEPGELVVDPFMGSGTTLRAAKDLSRNAIGIELDERYCEIAATRMAQAAMNLI